MSNIIQKIVIDKSEVELIFKDEKITIQIPTFALLNLLKEDLVYTESYLQYIEPPPINNSYR